MSQKSEQTGAELVLSIILRVVLDVFLFLAYVNIWGVPHAHGL